jgi:hypothetical protein
MTGVLLVRVRRYQLRLSGIGIAVAALTCGACRHPVTSDPSAPARSAGTPADILAAKTAAPVTSGTSPVPAAAPGNGGLLACQEQKYIYCTLDDGTQGRCLDGFCHTRAQCQDRCARLVEADGSCEELQPPCDGTLPGCKDIRRKAIESCLETRDYEFEACVAAACPLP